jgi:hypothetical protein
MRIAFDMDGVLADMDGALLRHAEALFGPDAVTSPSNGDASPADDPPDPLAEASPAESEESDPAAAAPPSALQLTERQHRRLWRHVSTVDNFWETLGEIEEGSVSRLAAVAAGRRWEVIFLTKRPATAGATSQVQTQRWLESKGFQLPSVFVVQGSRGRIASALALDIVVDDRAENCVDVTVDSRARALLVCRHHHEGVEVARRLGVGIVSSFNEGLDVLIAMDTAAPQPGVVERLKRLFRL